MAATLLVYNMQVRNIGRANFLVCPANPTVGRAGATALPVHYVPAPLTIRDVSFRGDKMFGDSEIVVVLRPLLVLSDASTAKTAAA